MTSEQVFHGLGRHISQLNPNERVVSLRVSANSISTPRTYQNTKNYLQAEELTLGLKGAIQACKMDQTLLLISSQPVHSANMENRHSGYACGYIALRLPLSKSRF